MRNRLSTGAITFALLVSVFFASCGDDPAAPGGIGTPTFSRLMGGVSEDYARDVVVTSDGLRVVTGVFRGVMHVTGEADSLIGSFGPDLFLTAFQPDGSVAWMRGIGGAGEEVPFVITRDADDNLYVGGYYRDNTTFGATNLTGYGFGDALVAKLDAAGNPVWAAGGGAAGTDIVFGVTVAPNGQVFACGSASSEIALAGEDVGEFGSTSGFLVAIGANGVGIWGATASGTGLAACFDLVQTNDGNVYVCGDYSGSTVAIGGETFDVDGENDAFIAGYTDGGLPAGAFRIGGTGGINVLRMTLLGGELVVIGNFSGVADFDVSSAAGEVTAAGGSDAFVARYTTGGTLRWVRTFGTADDEVGMDVTRIGAADLLICGAFGGSLTLGSKTLNTRGAFDYFLARLDGEGNVRYAEQLGGPNSDNEAAVASANGVAIIVGRASGAFRFPDGTTRTASGSVDGFIYQRR